MNTKIDQRSWCSGFNAPFFLLCTLVLIAIFLVSTSSFGAPITEKEAVAVADLWYASELNSSHVKLGAKERSARLALMEKRRVHYLLSKEDLEDTYPAGGKILAFVVEYKPKGFVVVSSDDRLDPIVVFSVRNSFRWDQPERNFFRYFLGTTMTESFKYLNRKLLRGESPEVHPNWIKLRTRLSEGLPLEKTGPPEGPSGTIYVLWATPLWNQCSFYNDTVSAYNGNNNCVPTGCTATAMAIKMRFHRWPPRGYDSHTYTDNYGLGYTHTVNFANQTYSWSAMPMTDLTQVNYNVADLMYHAGVAVNMMYRTGCCGGKGSAAWPTAYSMNHYFNYVGTIDNNSGNPSDHFTPLKESVRGGLPVVACTATHTFVVDGYRDTQSPYFHINCGWSGSGNGWYNLSMCPTGGQPAPVVFSDPYCQPANYVYVDRDYNGAELGTLKEPYNTFLEGYNNCQADGHLWLKGPKSYIASPTTLNKKMTIHSYEGSATVSQ